MHDDDLTRGPRVTWRDRLAAGRTDVALIVATVFGEVLFTVPGVILTGAVAALFHYGWADHRSITLATLVLLVAVVVEGFRELLRGLKGQPVRWRSMSGISAAFAVAFVFWLVGVVGT